MAAREWTQQPMECPQQWRDDCGVFMWWNVRHRALRLPVGGAAGPVRGGKKSKTVVERLRMEMAAEIRAERLTRPYEDMRAQ